MEVETMDAADYRKEVSKKTRKNPESHAQSRLMRWADVTTGVFPELDLLFAIPNGGYRHIATATRMKHEGVKAGVPDLFLPVARGELHGLFVEMKAGKNKPSKSQKEWLEALGDQGYGVVVCYGWEEARDAILFYLKG